MQVLFCCKFAFFFNTTFLSSRMYPDREPRRDPSNHRLYEHGICIRHHQDSNSEPVPSQLHADSSRPVADLVASSCSILYWFFGLSFEVQGMSLKAWKLIQNHFINCQKFFVFIMSTESFLSLGTVKKFSEFLSFYLVKIPFSFACIYIWFLTFLQST